LQTAQAPSHAVSQQTPSTQFPLAHSRASEHAEPRLARRLHRPAAHHALGAQSVSAEQSPRQAVAPHSNGAQSTVTAARHAPAPSQTAASLAVPFVQLGAPQVVDAGAGLHAPTLPSRLQAKQASVHAPSQQTPSAQ
jgi:hypothetical protein